MIPTDEHEELRQSVRASCERLPGEYWRSLDAKREYPEEFVRVMTEEGYLGALIPEEYGGWGVDLTSACVILEEINRSGANANQAHAQMYTMGTLLRHGSEKQKKEYLPKIASGELRLQAFGVTEPEAGTDTTSLTTTAIRDGDEYVVNGRKIYISRVQHSDVMILGRKGSVRGRMHHRPTGRWSPAARQARVTSGRLVGKSLSVDPQA